VIYTSGSTGAPKGRDDPAPGPSPTGWSGRPACLDFRPGRRGAVQGAASASTISINEIFLPLTTGAALAIAAPGEERDVEALVRGDGGGEQVSFCYLVSSMLAAMLELPDLPGRERPRCGTCGCGGELLTPELFAAVSGPPWLPTMLPRLRGRPRPPSA